MDNEERPCEMEGGPSATPTDTARRRSPSGAASSRVLKLSAEKGNHLLGQLVLSSSASHSTKDPPAFVHCSATAGGMCLWAGTARHAGPSCSQARPDSQPLAIAPAGATHQPSAGMRWTRVGGRAPLWGDRLDSDKAGPWRYLFFPLLVYQFVCYTCRCACCSNQAPTQLASAASPQSPVCGLIRWSD